MHADPPHGCANRRSLTWKQPQGHIQRTISAQIPESPQSRTAKNRAWSTSESRNNKLEQYAKTDGDGAGKMRTDSQPTHQIESHTYNFWRSWRLITIPSTLYHPANVMVTYGWYAYASQNHHRGPSVRNDPSTTRNQTGRTPGSNVYETYRRACYIFHTSAPASWPPDVHNLSFCYPTQKANPSLFQHKNSGGRWNCPMDPTFRQASNHRVTMLANKVHISNLLQSVHI